jgi:transcriptional regulator with XRE-family HTH domain
MMAGRPTERAKRRAAALRRAREDAGRTQQEAADALDRSQPTIARIEAGTRAPSPDEVRALLSFYDTPHPLRDEIEAWATLPDAPALGAPSPNRHLLELVRAAESAEEIFTFHSERTPLQLQSQQYALLQSRLAGACLGETDVLRAREERRRMFTRGNPPPYHALLTEASLYRAPGGSSVVVRQQAGHLLDLLDKYPQFSLRIVHFDARIAYIDTDFTWLRMPGRQADMVYVPFNLDGRLIKGRSAVQERETYWYEAQRAALTEDESRKFIHDLAQHGKTPIPR